MPGINCKALYPYNGAGGEQITTLDFDAGDFINVTFTGDTGWWEGELNGERGWFPASYVTKIEASDSASVVSSESWQEAIADNGETYYVNTETNETSWELPLNVSIDKSEIIETSANISTNNGNVNGNSLHLSPLDEESATEEQTQPPSPAKVKEPSSPPSSPGSKSNSEMQKPDSSAVVLRSKKPSNSPQCNGHAEKPLIRVVNGISFPVAEEAKDQSLLQPGRYSYCDYFWSDKGDNYNFQSGFCILYQKMLKEKQICKEIVDLFKARENLELQYAKGLASIANSMLASQEEGTLGEALKQMKAATMLESKVHQDFAGKLRSDVEQPLLEERERARKELKRIESSMSDIRKQVQTKYQAAEKSKQMLIERSKDYETKRTSTKYTKDEEQRARRKSTKQAEDLKVAVNTYNHTRQQWFEDMVTSSLVLERHEIERVKVITAVMTQYTKILQESTTQSHQTCDLTNQHITIIDADKDRELWVRKHATGKIKPIDLMM